MADGLLGQYGSQAKTVGAIITLVVAISSAGTWIYDGQPEALDLMLGRTI